jgi:hypothetical protein
MSSRFPAIEMLRQYPDVGVSDPIHRAAMFEARARDCLAEARWNEQAGHAPAAAVFFASYEADMQHSREILEAAAGQEDSHAA